MSPSFPVGAYAYSHGLENAIEQGLVTEAGDALSWISDLLTIGSGQTDLVLLARTWECANDPSALDELVALGCAFWPGAEIRNESLAQGDAFLRTIRETWSLPAIDRIDYAELPYPIAVGLVAEAHGVEQWRVLTAFAHAFSANLVSAVVRLVPLGQTDGQRISAALQNAASVACTRALETPLDALASSTLMSDICGMRHESQYTRLFRS
ncbi:MAG: urease accessory protein UreF [Woeseiaceae bacterium]